MNCKNIHWKYTKIRELFTSLLILLVILSCINLSILVRAETVDLEIYDVDLPTSLIEGDSILIAVQIKNNGDENITSGEIKLDLLIDTGYIPVSTNSTYDGISAGAIIWLNLSWIAEPGEHSLTIVLSYNDIEQDTRTLFISVSDRRTDLAFAQPLFFQGKIQVGNPVSIFANITNTGKNTTKDVNVTLYINGIYYNHSIINGLAKDEVSNCSFEWTPTSFGYHTVNVTLDPNKKITEEDETNNYIETQVSVDASGLNWWNASWHYRKFYEVDNQGNLSDAVNFTQLLRELSVIGKTFENDTIVIVKYTSSGELDGVVSEYLFNESDQFDMMTNAIGELIWEVSEPSFYCIYFDVQENKGDRKGFNETDNMTGSGNPTILFEGSAEGWWSENTLPINNYYLPEERIAIRIKTVALANSTKAIFYYNGSYDHAIELQTTNYLIWSENETLSIEGNWTIEIVGNDDADYQADTLQFEFYIGYPDLTVNSLNFSSELPESSPFYEGNIVKIDTLIESYNTTVNNVTIGLFIDDELIETKTNLTIELDKKTQAIFEWQAETAGTHKIAVFVDPFDMIEESNEDNNEKSKYIHIEGKPDLGIVNVSFLNQSVDEGDPVIFYVNITNTGKGNATQYRINLYLEQNDVDNDGNVDDVMYYKQVKNHTFINLTVNKTLNLTLIWDSTEYGVWKFDGEWVAGIKIITNSTHPDSNSYNNSYALLGKRVKIVASERDPPEITLLKPSGRFEQGKPVEILVRVTDASGLKSVTVTITDPQNTEYSYSMISQLNDRYQYIFNETMLLGIYRVKVTAVDASVNQSTNTVTGQFSIVGDTTPPTIDYVGVAPQIQLTNIEVTITCVTSDPVCINKVQMTLTFPDGHTEIEDLSETSTEGKYEYTTKYNELGFYEFFVTSEDTAENTKKSETKEFWITNDLDDTDSDGMPDWWEEKYGFDPYDPTDAENDEDDDGVTNIEEYKGDTNPLEPQTFLQTFTKQFKEHWVYFVVAVILFFVLIGLIVYGIGRKKYEVTSK
jgi:hypothetical protein